MRAPNTKPTRAKTSRDSFIDPPCVDQHYLFVQGVILVFKGPMCERNISHSLAGSISCAVILSGLEILIKNLFLLPLSNEFIIKVYAISPLLFSRLYDFRIIGL